MSRSLQRLVTVLCAISLPLLACGPPRARDVVRIRMVETVPIAAAPVDPCSDYGLLEAGRGSPDRQETFNQLDARGYARWRMACTRGWGEDQYRALDAIWTPESGWNHLADGPGSCWGIPQRCPGSTMAPWGDDWRTNPRVQDRAGLDYIAGRYGTPEAALAFRRNHGWY